MRWRLAGAAAVAAAALTVVLIWQGADAPSPVSHGVHIAQASSTSLASPPPVAFAGAGGGDESLALATTAHTDEAAQSAAARYAYQLTTLREALQGHQDAPGNLRAFFSELARHCDDAQACHALLTDILASYPDAAFAEMVARIQERLPHYEAAMQATVMSTSDPARARFEALHMQREQWLGVEETELMFGQEAAWARYRFDYGDLLQQAAYLPPTQRQQALDTLRQQHFTAYGAALHDLEGRHGAYQHALALQLAGVDDAGEQQRITQALRAQFFPPDDVAAMAARDQQIAHQQETIARYQQALAALEAEFGPLQAQLPAAEWQSQYRARLEALRREHFSAP